MFQTMDERQAKDVEEFAEIIEKIPENQQWYVVSMMKAAMKGIHMGIEMATEAMRQGNNEKEGEGMRRAEAEG